jgi:hypothetical protein
MAARACDCAATSFASLGRLMISVTPSILQKTPALWRQGAAHSCRSKSRAHTADDECRTADVAQQIQVARFRRNKAPSRYFKSMSLGSNQSRCARALPGKINSPQRRSTQRTMYNDRAAHRANATSPQRSAHRIPYIDHAPPTGNQTAAHGSTQSTWVLRDRCLEEGD